MTIDPLVFTAASAVISSLVALSAFLLKRVLKKIDDMDAALAKFPNDLVARFERMAAKLETIPIELVAMKVALDQTREDVRSLREFRSDISGFLSKHGFEARRLKDDKDQPG